VARPGFRSTAARYPWKVDITTLVFWIGESKSRAGSAWNPNWESDFGGVDAPFPALRHNYIPAKFTPRLNPFYCELPYNDVTEGTTKPEAPMIIPWFREAYRKQGQSVCENRWVEIQSASGRTCFAQWSDCGPGRTDDWQYVFGNERLASGNPGLGVSPAVRDYLGLGFRPVTSWRFIDFNEVPPGPWSLYGDNNEFVINARMHAAESALGGAEIDSGTSTVISEPSPAPVPATITR